ncbi:GNAT family N-acetyltransferase [Stappia sp. ES.058]|uniref:GNAT family N-acetyltransferase n=1 Tax=Stappia sp. ES.058 TaxID=1881061 RepID=UPI000879EB05|nr:N-acetyltransferase [Stappia sp. ES.058]SDU14495.1 Ribosomal protein S18 acetylase RimI [Stappia sp. ES.058]
MNNVETITIRRATAGDAERLNAALSELSQTIGDAHEADAGALLRHGFNDVPAFSALIAETDAGDLRGALLCSPVFSTTYGGAGVYVSDLWVSDDARGQGLGRRLLAAATEMAPESWDVRFLKLAVYDDNPRAAAFYDRLGFRDDPRETVLRLAKTDFYRLTDAT